MFWANSTWADEATFSFLSLSISTNRNRLDAPFLGLGAPAEGPRFGPVFRVEAPGRPRTAGVSGKSCAAEWVAF